MEGKETWFGQAHNTYGSQDAGLVLKTSGPVRIQWRRKFIDLIKDGKINVDVPKVVKQVASEGDMSDDGLYVIGEGEDAKVVLKVGDMTLTLSGEIGTTYVSFMATQETTSDQKHTALENIGFVYGTMDDIDESSLANGIIYVESTQKLYTVVDGTLTEYTFEFPNPYTKQFVIAKDDGDDGALYIVGEGRNNSLAFDGFRIYHDGIDGYIDADGKVYIRCGDTNVVIVDKGSVTIDGMVTADGIQYPGSTDSTGFRLYMANGESTLEIDNLVVRNGISVDLEHPLYPLYWHMHQNVTKTVSAQDSDDEFVAMLKYENMFTVGDIVCIHCDDVDDDGVTTIHPHYFDVIDTDTDTVTLRSQVSADDSLATAMQYSTVFLVYSSDAGWDPLQLRTSSYGVDIVTVEDGTIHSRYGSIGPIGISIHDGNVSDNDGIVPVDGYGLYSSQAVFLEAAYSSDYGLDDDDDSSRLASTEWVRLCVKANGGMTDEEKAQLDELWQQYQAGNLGGGGSGEGGLTEGQVKALIEESLVGYATKEELEQLENDVLKTLQDLEDMFYVRFDESTRRLSITIGHPTSIGGEVLDNTYTVTIPCYGESGGGDGGYSEEQIKGWISEAIEDLKSEYDLDTTVQRINELYGLYIEKGWPTGGDGGYDDTQLKSQVIRLLTQVANESYMTYNSSTGLLSINWAYPDEWVNSGDFDTSTTTKSVTISTSSGGGDVDLTDVYSRLDALDEHYESLQTLVFGMNDTLSDINNNQLPSLSTRVTTVENNLSSLQTLVYGINDTMTELLNVTIPGLNSGISQNASDIASLQSTVSAQQQSIQELQSLAAVLQYGDASNPVVLVSGKIARVNGGTNWTFSGSMKDRITSVSVPTWDNGSIFVEIATSYSLNIMSLQATQALSGATYNAGSSIEERNYGAHWFEASVYAQGVTVTTLRIREFHNANGNNDSWATLDTVSDSKTIREINITVLGYIS